MKKMIRPFICCYLLVIIMFSFYACSSAKKTAAAKPNDAAVNVTTTSYAGTWLFTVTGTPDGDTKGEMILTPTGNGLKGVVTSGVGQSEIKDLKIVNSVLTGTFDYNGMAISMAGTFNGDNFEGKVEAQGYSFPLVAKRK